MTYTVFGFQSGTLNTAQLQIDMLKRKAELVPFSMQERMMRGYGVDAEGFDFLERRFGGDFQKFVLLDDVAIEACHAFNASLGKPVGTMELDEMRGLAIKLFAWAYWTEA